jgi:nucleoid-associated protein EbfC
MNGENQINLADIQRQIADAYDQARSVAHGAKQALEDLKNEEFTAEAADGLVSATVSGLGELTSLKIHVLAKRRLDNLTLGEAVTEAVRSAEHMFRDRQQSMFSAIKINGRSFQDLMTDPMSCIPDLGNRDS